MNALGEGRLSITIHAKNAVYNQVSGYIVPRFTCDIFDSVLSTIDEDQTSATSSSKAISDFGAKIVTFSCKSSKTISGFGAKIVTFSSK